MTCISFKNVSKSYPGGVEALCDFSLEIAKGEFVVLVGPSGCGKSTVLKMIEGTEEVSEGQLFLDGAPAAALPAKDRDVAMVFQNYALYPHKTIYKNMAYGLELRKTPPDEIEKRVREVARALDIERLLEQKPMALSDGQRQRVALGRAMVRNPAVFLLDDPLSSLDAKLRVAMRDELRGLHRRLDATFVYVTSDQDEAMSLGERIVVMEAGRVRQADSPQNLYNSPADLFVAGFIGSPQMNFIDGQVKKAGEAWVFDTGFDKLPLPPEKAGEKLEAFADKPLKLGLRPEDIREDKAFLDEHPKLVLDAVVEVSELLGSQVYLYLGYQGTRLVARAAPDTGSRMGSRIRVGVDTRKAHLFETQSGKAIG